MAKNTGIAQFSTGRRDVHMVDPRKLVLEKGWNTRDEGPDLDAHIDMIAQSIANNGFHQTQPISVKMIDGQMVVRGGHCRTRACLRAIEHYGADLKAVPVIPFDRNANDAEMVLDQVISNNGKPLTLLEEARVYQKLVKFGWEQGDIAKKVGKSNGRISQILALLEMPAQAQALVATGAVSASLAHQVVKQAETPQAAVQTLTNAVQQATENGSGKVKPADVNVSHQPKQQMTFKQCFDNSEIDNSEETTDEGYVLIKMPVEDFEFIRQALKL
jgi:ParB family chromosome partitioning protein